MSEQVESQFEDIATAIVHGNKQIAAHSSEAKHVWSTHSTSDSEEENHINDNVKEQK